MTGHTNGAFTQFTGTIKISITGPREILKLKPQQTKDIVERNEKI